MKKIYFTLIFTIACISLQAQLLQFATKVIDFSSQYDFPDYAAIQALSAPNSEYGDAGTAWASETSDGQREYLVLGFDTPLPIDSIFIYENYNPGSIDTVYLRNSQTNQWEIVWSGTAFSAPAEYRIFKIGFPLTTFDVSEVRIAINSPAVSSWNEIDAVGIFSSVGSSDLVYASSVLNFSSEYESVDWGSIQALNEPNTYPNYGDIESAWASETDDDQREFLELGFNNTLPIRSILIYETYNPGAIDTVYVKNPGTNEWEIVWSGPATILPKVSRIFTIDFPATPYPVSEVRIALNSPAVPGWNEIDAVAIIRTSFVAPIPTMSEWLIFLFGLIMVNVFTVTLYNQNILAKRS